MNIKRTIITTLVALTLVAVVAPVVASATTVSDLQAQINALMAQLNALQGTTGTTPVPTGKVACAGVTFSRYLRVGSVGQDVKCMQVLLNTNGYTLAATGAGSPGMETTYFGTRTLAGVRKWQAAMGWAPANQIGPLSRAKLNEWLGGTVVLPGQPTPTPSPVGNVSAMVATDNPASGAVICSQARAGLLNINFTGTGTVTSVTLQRSGISTSSTLTNVYLFDGATRLTSGYSFNTNGQLVMNGLNIAVNGSHEIQVLGDTSSLASGNCTTTSSSIAVALVGFNGGSANVQGNTMSIVTGSAASAVFPNGAVSAPVATTINPGATNQTLWSQSLTVSTRAVMLSGMTVKQIGSAPSNTLTNVGLYVDGTLASTTAINSNNQFVFTISNPVTLTTGSHLIEVHGDVVAGSTRTFTMYLEQGSDVALKDSQLGVYISPLETATAAVSNITSGLITVGGVVSGLANVIVNQDTAFNTTTTLVGGATNTTLASFKFTAYGENTNVTSLTFNPIVTTGRDSSADVLDSLANVGLYVNGGQIASSSTAVSGTPLVFSSLGSQIQIPVGTTVTVSIKGDVVSGPTADGTQLAAGNSKNYASGTIQFNLASGATQGVSSGATSTSGFSQTGQALSVSSTNVTLAGTTGFGTTATAAPNSAPTLASWTLTTGTAEGISLSSASVMFSAAAAGSNTAVANNDLTNVILSINGTAVSNPVGSPVAGSNSFPLSNVTVPANGSITITLSGTIGGSSSAYSIKPYLNVYYRGLTSNLSTDYDTANSLTSDPAGVAGTQTTVGAAAITSANVTTSTAMTAQFVTGNGTASPLSIATYNVKATSNVGGAYVRTMTFTNPAATGTITAVTVGGVTQPFSSSTATVTLPGNGIMVPANASGVNIPVTLTLACIGTNCSATANTAVELALTRITYYNGSIVVCDGTGCTGTSADSAALGAATATPVSYLVSTVPTVSMTTTNAPTSLVLGLQQIGTFTVSAGTSGDIKLEQIPFSVTVGGTSASMAIGSVVLYDQSGNTLANAPTTNGVINSGTFNWASTQYSIPAGTSQTFTVYGTLTGTLGTAATTSVTFTLGSKANFAWMDVTGGVPASYSTSSIPGTYIYGYPAGTQSKSN